MSGFNGAGTFVISAVGLPYVTGTTISSTVANQWNTDLATGLSTCLTKDGQTIPTANIPLGGFKLTGVGPPTAPGDVLVQGSPISVSDITVTGVKPANTVLIGPVSGVPAPPTWRTMTAADIPAGAQTGRNRIINGDFNVNARNGLNNVAVPAGLTYFTDRWAAAQSFAGKFQTQTLQAVPGGPIPTMQKIVSVSANVPAAPDANAIYQKIEQLNVNDLNFGQASALSVTLSFWIYSSVVTGNFGGCLKNDTSGNYRSFPFLFNVPAAATWTKINVVIPGDTTNPTLWAPPNPAMTVVIDLGSGSNLQGVLNTWQSGNFFTPVGAVNFLGTNGAQLFLTAVKLESGVVATPFVPDDTAVLVTKCQRYFQRYGNFNAARIGPLMNYGTSSAFGCVQHLPDVMRAAPTFTLSALPDFGLHDSTGAIFPLNSATPVTTPFLWGGNFFIATASFVAGHANIFDAAQPSAYYSLDAEL